VELDTAPAGPEVDSLLDKISREGIASLTAEEKTALERSSAALKERSRR